LLSVLKGESLAAWRERTKGTPKPKPPAKPAPSGTMCKGKLRPTLRRGSKGEHVTFLQKMIGASVDGDFGPKTEARVRWYQKMRRLPVTGVADPATWRSINQM
jgi:peptidoglycan hydrolase-like protein with peptidoglycan-binding domain